MSPSRIALLGGPAFFILWFIGAQILYFAGGGTTDGGPLPGPNEYPAVALSNRSGIHTGATLLARDLGERIARSLLARAGSITAPEGS